MGYEQIEFTLRAVRQGSIFSNKWIVFDKETGVILGKYPQEMSVYQVKQALTGFAIETACFLWKDCWTEKGCNVQSQLLVIDTPYKSAESREEAAETNLVVNIKEGDITHARDLLDVYLDENKGENHLITDVRFDLERRVTPKGIFDLDKIEVKGD